MRPTRSAAQPKRRPIQGETRMAQLKTVTDETFETAVLRAAKPTLVDFWAEWCRPCRMLEPMIERLADEHAESLSVVALDVQTNMETAVKYGILNIPALLLFVDGKPVKRLQGYMPLKKLLHELADYL